MDLEQITAKTGTHHAQHVCLLTKTYPSDTVTQGLGASTSEPENRLNLRPES